MNFLNDPNICASLALLSLGIAIVAAVGIIVISQRIKDARTLFNIKEIAR